MGNKWKNAETVKVDPDVTMVHVDLRLHPALYRKLLELKKPDEAVTVVIGRLLTTKEHV